MIAAVMGGVLCAVEPGQRTVDHRHALSIHLMAQPVKAFAAARKSGQPSGVFRIQHMNSIVLRLRVMHKPAGRFCGRP